MIKPRHKKTFHPVPSPQSPAISSRRVETPQPSHSLINLTVNGIAEVPTLHEVGGGWTAVNEEDIPD